MQAHTNINHCIQSNIDNKYLNHYIQTTKEDSQTDRQASELKNKLTMHTYSNRKQTLTGFYSMSVQNVLLA